MATTVTPEVKTMPTFTEATLDARVPSGLMVRLKRSGIMRGLK